MSYFSEELERQLQETSLSVDEVAQRSGISRGQIYLWKRGQQVSISKEQLTSLALSISGDAFHNARLVQAHLLDEKFGPGSEFVTVEIEHTALRDKPRQPRKSKREKAIEYLSELSLNNPTAADLLITLAVSHGAEL